MTKDCKQKENLSYLSETLNRETSLFQPEISVHGVEALSYAVNFLEKNSAKHIKVATMCKRFFQCSQKLTHAKLFSKYEASISSPVCPLSDVVLPQIYT